MNKSYKIKNKIGSKLNFVLFCLNLFLEINLQCFDFLNIYLCIYVKLKYLKPIISYNIYWMLSPKNILKVNKIA